MSGNEEEGGERERKAEAPRVWREGGRIWETGRKRNRGRGKWRDGLQGARLRCRGRGGWRRPGGRERESRRVRAVGRRALCLSGTAAAQGCHQTPVLLWRG